MNLSSVKTRLVGSYLALLLILAVQLPVMYLLVSSLSGKYSQVDTAGALRKRAVEITAVLYRHIITNDQKLEEEFQEKKRGYKTVIESLRKGSADFPAITGPDILMRLDAVAEKWGHMQKHLDEAMEGGDSLNESEIGFKETTSVMLDRLGGLGSFLSRQSNPANVKSVDIVSSLKLKTAGLDTLVERYVRSGDGGHGIGKEMEGTIADISGMLKTLRAGLPGRNIPAVKEANALNQLNVVEEVWQKRAGLALSIMKSNESFKAKMTGLIETDTREVVSAADTLTKQIAKSARKSAFIAMIIMAVAIVISAAVVALAARASIRHIINPIIKVKDVVESYIAGDLTRRADIKLRFFGNDIQDEIADLGKSVDKMGSQMSEIVDGIKDSSGRVANAVEKLSATAGQISSGANKQSAQTAHIATSMTEMTATAIEIAKNSQQASESAKDAQGTANNGGEVVTQASTAMLEVAESAAATAETVKNLGKNSEEVGTIVSVINDIADQTNLLALNAAIEAARAGEQGRGFAVVADEVKRLAERTTKATKEISQMIEGIQHETSKAVTAMDAGTRKVKNGVKHATEAGVALNQIVKSVESVSSMISQIATAAEEQSAVSDEMSRSMDGISDIAKSNVTAMSDVTKAAEDLSSLAARLQDMVVRFKTEDGRSNPSGLSVIDGGLSQKQLQLVRSSV